MKSMLHCNLQWLIKVVSLAGKLYRWMKRNIKGDQLTALSRNQAGCSNEMWKTAVDTSQLDARRLFGR